MMMPYYDEGGITIYHGDCRDVLPHLQTARLVVTDPPYVFGIASTTQENKKNGGWGDLMNAAVWYESWLAEAKRITANSQGAAWVFNSWRSFPILARAAYGIPWSIQSLLVWDKECIGQGGQIGLRPSYELAAIFCHAGFAIEDRSQADIWRFSWPSFKEYHPAEKPIPLLRKIINKSGGGSVLDPFLGSGSTLVAAKAEGSAAIGIEIEERYCEVAAKRLAQNVFDFQDEKQAAADAQRQLFNSGLISPPQG